MSIPFTDQELKRAWRQLKRTSQPPEEGPRENAHRLLLFYAVECGLKAVWLKRKNQTIFTVSDINKTGHNLGKILTQLRAGQHLELPTNIQLKPANIPTNRTIQRNGDIESLHQIWRYGGSSQSPTDEDCEEKLEQVLEWINGELQ